MALGRARQARLDIRGELIKHLDHRREALRVDLQLVLPVGIQRDIRGVTARTITGEAELPVGEPMAQTGVSLFCSRTRIDPDRLVGLGSGGEERGQDKTNSLIFVILNHAAVFLRQDRSAHRSQAVYR